MLFIGGLQRSGTTLLGRSLAEHPLVAGLHQTGTDEDEGQFVQDVYLDDHIMGHRGNRTQGRVARWAYHPEAHLTEQDAHRTPDAATRLTAAWSPYVTDPTAPYLVEKSPSNMTRFRFLQEAFPDAGFVLITRHPIIQALAIRKWSPRSAQIGLDLSPIIDHWFTAMDIAREDASKISNLRVVAYENLIREPATVLRGIQVFFGLPPQEVRAEHFRDESAKYTKYWTRVSDGKPIDSSMLLNPRASGRSAVPRFLERHLAPRFGPGNLRRIRAQYGSRFSEYGYSLDDLDTVTTWRHLP